MNTKTKWLSLLSCLAAGVSFGSDSIAPFVKQSLGFDLASVQFGQPVSSVDYVKADYPLTQAAFALRATEWKTSPVSSQYHNQFPNRTVSFGFLGGRLTVVHISIESFDPNHLTDGDPNAADKLRQASVKIFEAYEAAKPAQTKSSSEFTDDRFRISAAGACGFGPGAAIMDFEISAVPGMYNFNFPILPDASH